MAAGALALAFTTGVAAADLPVDLELVLAIDTSSSVDRKEFKLQVGGYAQAFRDPAVVEAIKALGGQGIAVTVVQWSAHEQQVQSVGWTHIRDRAGAAAFADAIERQPRSFRTSGTALGTAIAYTAGLFRGNGFAGKRRAIDISADERANEGTDPTKTRDRAVAAGITVNGLAILSNSIGLERYFWKSVIGGPDAFVVTAQTYRAVASAIRLKLLREIAAPAVSLLD